MMIWNCLVTLINEITIDAATEAGAFQNGNGHILTSVRRKYHLTIAFVSSPRATSCIPLSLSKHIMCYKKMAYICIHIYIYIGICKYIYISCYVCVHIYIYILLVFKETYIYIYIYICIHVDKYIYIYTCMHIHIYRYVTPGSECPTTMMIIHQINAAMATTWNTQLFAFLM